MTIKIYDGMKKKIFSILIIFILCSFFIKVSAQEIPPPENILDSINIHLTITTPTNSLYDEDISVEACESDNPASGNLKTTPYCAILQTNLDSTWNTGWAPGIFLDSIDNVAGYTSEDAEGNPVYHYWSWSLNNEEAIVGLNQYDLQENDLIALTFIDPVILEPEPEPEPAPEINVSSGSSSGSSRVSTKKEKKEFNLEKAFQFLSDQQEENGSFGEDLYTDWVALAYSSSQNYPEIVEKLKQFLVEDNLENPNLTDYQRRTLALMSLNINPYKLKQGNYIEKITAQFDGIQFGDKQLINDDIFALIILQNAGFTKDEIIIQKTVEFILSRQKENGSWEDSVDLTGAAIEALASALGAEPAPKALATLEKARIYLKENQKNDGGWDNPSATSWALQGIMALRENPSKWEQENKNPLIYLAEEQDEDGGIKNKNVKNRIWQTAYVTTSLSGKTWNQIMNSFEKEIIQKPEITLVIPKEIIKKETISQLNKKIEKEEIIPEIITSELMSENQNEKSETKNKFRGILLKILNIIF